MSERLAQIRTLIAEEMGQLPVERHDPVQGIPLQVTGFGADEVYGAVEALVSTWVTMGKRVRAFEEAFADWVGTRHAVMVNSGSSANLVGLAALVHTGQLRLGDEVLVPAVAWSTSLFPVAQCGLRPVLVDVDPQTLCIDVALAAAAMGPRTRGVIAVHLLGQPADVRGLKALDLVVLEDACAAHGAQIGGRRCGGLGAVGTFSFFFSHHITTIEGGMIVTDDHAVSEAARALRAHGWIRELDGREAVAQAHPEIDPRFLFTAAGWNLRPTEVAGAFGLRQLQRLDAWVERRRTNHREWCAALADFSHLQVFPERPGGTHAAFAFPMLLSRDAPVQRAEFMSHLESRKIATRPISGSNLARQPAFARVPGARVHGELPVSDAVHTRGLFIGNSHAFHQGHRDLLVSALSEVF
jgi:CDP-6-deoxy-D-xylo-4-hexulose-3-dehydrase